MSSCVKIAVLKSYLGSGLCEWIDRNFGFYDDNNFALILANILNFMHLSLILLCIASALGLTLLMLFQVTKIGFDVVKQISLKSSEEIIKNLPDIFYQIAGTTFDQASKADPVTRVLYQSASVTIISATLFAWTSMFMLMAASEYLQDNNQILIAMVPLLWAGLVFSFDRSIVAGEKNRGAFIALRLSLAAIIAVTVSVAFELTFFKGHIDRLSAEHLRSKANIEREVLVSAQNQEYEQALTASWEIHRHDEQALENAYHLLEMESQNMNIAPVFESCRQKEIYQCRMSYENTCDRPSEECFSKVIIRSDCKKGEGDAYQEARDNYIFFENQCRRETESAVDAQIDRPKKIEDLNAQIRKLTTKIETNKIAAPQPVYVVSQEEASSELLKQCNFQGAICVLKSENYIVYNSNRLGILERMTLWEAEKEKLSADLNFFNEFRVKHLFAIIFALFEIMPTILGIVLKHRLGAKNGVVEAS